MSADVVLFLSDDKRSEDDTLRDVIEEIKRNPSSLNKIWGGSGWAGAWGAASWAGSSLGTLLHFSCIWNRPKVVSFLLSQQDVDVTKKFSSGWLALSLYDGLTAQQIAEKRGYVEIVNLFEKSKREAAIREQAERERIAREKAEREKVAREKAEREKVAREKAEKEKIAREQAERGKIAREAAKKEQSEIYQFLIQLGFNDTVIQKIKSYGVSKIEDFVHFGKEDWDSLALPPFQKNKIINKISQPIVNIPSQPSPSLQQKSSPTVQTSPNELNLRFFDNLESNTRAPLAPYILLDSSESPVPFKDAILCVYEGESISDDLNIFMLYGEEEIFENLKKVTTITLPECLAVYFYTLEWPQKDLNTYSRLNKCLVSEKREDARPWRFFLHYLFEALRKIPKWNGQQDLYRGVARNLVKDYPDKYIPGKKITWYSFTSTTTNLPKIKSFLPQNKPRTIITINGVFSGRSIQNFSVAPNEAEILIPPGSRFEVMGVLEVDKNTTMIQMKQIPSLEKLLNLE